MSSSSRGNFFARDFGALWLAGFIGAFWLTACGDSQGPSSAVMPSTESPLTKKQPQEICDGLVAQPAATVQFITTTCPSCVAQNLQAAADGSYDTVSTIRFAATAADTTGAFQLRATAAPGTVFSTGFAGVYRGLPLGDDGFAVNQANFSQGVRTYLSGVLQETSLMGSSSYSGAFNESFGLQSFTPTLPYDSVELNYQWTGVRVPAKVRISEFCTTSRASMQPISDPPRAPRASAQREIPDAQGIIGIDVLMLYTSRFGRAIGGDSAARQRAADLIAKSNRLFVNSNINVRYRLLDVQPYSNASETMTTLDTYSLLAADPDVKKYRDAVKADITALLLSKDLGFDLCGKASLFNGGRQSAEADSVDPDMDGYAVVAAIAGQFIGACNDVTLPHEFGHVLAGGHEASSVLGTGAYWKPYSHASACGNRANGGMQPTVMSEESDDNSQLFSSPLLMRDGQACGSAGTDGAESTQADNARAIREAAPYVAAYH